MVSILALSTMLGEMRCMIQIHQKFPSDDAPPEEKLKFANYLLGLAFGGLFLGVALLWVGNVSQISIIGVPGFLAVASSFAFAQASLIYYLDGVRK